MCTSDPGGGAGVPQVVLVDLPLSGSDHQTGTVWSEVNRGQRTVHPDRPEHAARGHNLKTFLNGSRFFLGVNRIIYILGLSE